jgi:type II secretory pathway pseudopilin PulG
VSGKCRKYGGFLWTEAAVAMIVMGVILVSFALLLDGFRRFNNYQLVRQRCIAAAGAQLDSITAAGKPIRDEDIERLWPKLSVSIKKSPGTGRWQEMTLVEVTACGKSFHNEVKVRLSRYISQDRLLQGQTPAAPPTEGK